MAKSGPSRMTAPEDVFDLSPDDDVDVPDARAAPAVLPDSGISPNKRARTQPAVSGTNAKSPGAPSADWLIQEVGLRDPLRRARKLPKHGRLICIRIFHPLTPSVSTRGFGPWYPVGPCAAQVGVSHLRQQTRDTLCPTTPAFLSGD